MDTLQALFEYYRFFSQYVNPVAVFTSATLYALLAFTVLLLVLVLLRKRVLLQRRYGFLKYVAWLYFAAIPLLGAFFAFQLAALNSVHHQIKENLTAELNQYAASLDTDWQTLIIQAASTGMNDSMVPKIDLTPDQAIEIASEVLYHRYKTAIDSSLTNDPNLMIQALGYINSLSDGKVLAYGIKKGIHKLLADYLVDEATTDELMATRLDELMKQGILGKIFTIQLDRIFTPLKKSLIITFCFIMLLLLIEIILAHYWLRQANASQQGNL